MIGSVEVLQHVFGMNHLSYLCGELEDWRDGILVLFPAPHGIWIFSLHFSVTRFRASSAVPPA